MSQDLTFIRNELKGFKEIDSPFDLKKGKCVKYITIKDGEEYFYTGGKYKRMGDNKIFLEAKPSSCILQIKDKMGNVTYSTKIFTEGDELETCNKDKEEYKAPNDINFIGALEGFIVLILICMIATGLSRIFKTD